MIQHIFNPLHKAFTVALAAICMMVLVACDSSSSSTPDPAPPTPEGSEQQPPVINDDPKDSVYLNPFDHADATYFLPEPPGIDDNDFIDDKVQWEWGKTQRATERGTVANIRMGRTPASVRAMIEGSLKLNTTINETNTPALWQLMRKAYWTGFQSAAATKKAYLRERPFVVMGETPWYAPDADDATGSYTSASTAGGWATALAFAEMWPLLQNTILRVGFLYGEDRVISGSNFQSDVNGGYLCGAAAIALAHNNATFKTDIAAAREEYKKLMGLPASEDPTDGTEDPVGARFLNPPVFTGTPRYWADLARYEHAKTYRGSIRGQQAIQDTDTDTDYMTKIFGSTMFIFDATEETTPCIAALINHIYEHSVNVANELKDTYFRPRPFVELEESTPVPEDEYMFASSSYASGHACFSWAIALALAEAVPEHKQTILKRAFDFGYNRQIVGYHWASDIEAGRLLACALIAHLHTDDTFCQLLQQVRTEYLSHMGK